MIPKQVLTNKNVFRTCVQKFSGISPNISERASKLYLGMNKYVHACFPSALKQVQTCLKQVLTCLTNIDEKEETNRQVPITRFTRLKNTNGVFSRHFGVIFRVKYQWRFCTE